MRVSVIIPTLNEEQCLPDTLARLGQDRPAEIIVADGGSDDATATIAERYARVVRCPRGRAVQQNAGAAAASGDVLLFLHADCWPEPGWQRAVQRAAQRADFVAGCFQMRIDAAGPLYRAIERGGDLRARWLGLAYGDQGIVVRRETFQRLGGFSRVGLMEDVLFMQRVQQLGRVHLLRHPIHVSPRRWQQVGVVRQTLRNWQLTALAVWGGVHPDQLARLYPDVR